MAKRCRACLITERKLYVLVGALRDLFSKFVPQISKNEEVLICWECKASVRHIYLFCKKAQQSQQVFHDYNSKGSTSKCFNIEPKSSLVMTVTEIYSVPNSTVNFLEIPIKEELTKKLYLNCSNEYHGYNLKSSPEEEEYSDIESKSNIDIKYDNNDITENLIKIPIKGESTEKLNLYCENESPITNYHLDHDYISTAPKTLIKSESTSKDDCGSKTDTSEIKTIQNPVKKRVRKKHDSYTCKDCGKVFDSRGKLSYHKAVHKTRPQCKECGKTLGSVNALWRHNILMHRKNFTCDLCKKIFSTEARYQAHKSCPGSCRDENYCSPCDMFFKTYRNLCTHQLTSKKHFDPDTWIHSCSECDRKFPSPKIVRDHYKTVHAEKKFSCDQCQLKYSSRCLLRKHVKRQHDKIIQPKDKVCEFCGKSFQTLQLLKAHRRTHTGERPFCCSFCSARFTQSGALYTHKRLVHQRVKRRRANESKS